jgi:hypothetical protein
VIALLVTAVLLLGLPVAQARSSERSPPARSSLVVMTPEFSEAGVLVILLHLAEPSRLCFRDTDHNGVTGRGGTLLLLISG